MSFAGVLWALPLLSVAKLPRVVRCWLKDCRGGVAPIAALSLVPLVGFVGAAVDYSRASDVRVNLQAALDSALLAGAKDGTTSWAQVALNTFNATVVSKGSTVGTPNFSLSGSDTYAGSVSAAVLPAFVSVLGLSSINVTASSTVVGGLPPDNSCILTLDTGQASTDISLLFGGAPNISLTNCSVRSNTSLSCNGHNSGSAESIAAGTATSCANPVSGARVVPDIYASLATKITPICGGTSVAVNWTAGSSNPPAAVKTVVQSGYTEYHVCGDLNLSGSGTLINSGSDSVVVIENGSLNLGNSANVSTVGTAIVLTGNDNHASAINFPNGNGQSATLALSPPTSSGDPWLGIALYQDPALTNGVTDNWGPGATLNVDGIVYLPNANVTMRGVAASNNYQCTKFVSNSFQTNGSVSLSFAQANSGCTMIGMKQWSDVPIHLSQ
ncbi:MAG TPA: pilus assembly protein TadG-related protein [Pseudolabrys sp.]|nr:pilus assembly protein TadG-related protein [Pseudolabrys sp.]